MGNKPPPPPQPQKTVKGMYFCYMNQKWSKNSQEQLENCKESLIEKL